MSVTIEQIREAMLHGRHVFSRHAVRELAVDKMLVIDGESAILTGEIVRSRARRDRQSWTALHCHWLGDRLAHAARRRMPIRSRRPTRNTCHRDVLRSQIMKNEYPTHPCDFCSGTVQATRANSEPLLVRDGLVLVDGVQIGKCDRCGHTYFPAAIVKAAERVAQHPDQASRVAHVPVVAA